MKRLFIIIVLSFLIPTLMSAQGVNLLPDDILIEDFESWPLNKWTFEGDAFSPVKQDPMFVDSWGDRGYRGYGYMSSFIHYDAGVGQMTSREFEIKRHYINFLLAGGNYENDTYAALIVDGKEVRKSSGLNNRRMEWYNWDVSEFKGKNARIRLVDTYRSYYGFVVADHFVQSDNAYQTPKCKVSLKVKGNYIFLPLNNEMPLVRLNILKDNKILYEFSMPLDGKNPKYWAPLCVKDLVGKSLEFISEDNENVTAALKKIRQGKTKRDILNSLGESFRPVYHFTSRVGHLNDPNGIYYSDGQWHFFYQHNPFGVQHGNTSWGSAISTDLTHWEEGDEILYPDENGLVFSGSALIDKDQLFQFYTYGAGYTRISEGKSHAQGYAISKDNGKTWEKQGLLDVPRLSKDQRDPTLFWHEESGHWCMALFIFDHEYAIFTSDDKIHWSLSDRFFVEGGEECPDMFRMKVSESPDKMKWVFMCANSTYLIGEFDGYRFYPQSKAKRLVDGSFYAAKSFLNAPDDRRVIMACKGVDLKDCAFSSIIYYPREATLHVGEDGLYELWSVPVKELDSFAKPVISDKNVAVSPARPAKWTTSTAAFRMKIEFGSETPAGLSLDFDGAVFNVPEGIHSLTILSDKYTIEINTEDGRYSTAFPIWVRPGKAATSLRAKTDCIIKKVTIEEIK